jgi:hypothetical protein
VLKTSPSNYLLFGALVAAAPVAVIATAWSLVYVHYGESDSIYTDAAQHYVIREHRTLGRHSYCVQSSFSYAMGAPFGESLPKSKAREIPYWVRLPGPPPKQLSPAITVATGWPWPCAVMTIEDINAPYTSASGTWWLHNRPRVSEDPPAIGGAIPYRIMPVPFICNTGVFASAIAAVWMLRKQLSSTYRIRNRQCQGCGYSIVGLNTPRCPECGRPFESLKARMIDLCIVIALATVVLTVDGYAAA